MKGRNTNKAPKLEDELQEIYDKKYVGTTNEDIDNMDDSGFVEDKDDEERSGEKNEDDDNSPIDDEDADEDVNKEEDENVDKDENLDQTYEKEIFEDENGEEEEDEASHMDLLTKNPGLQHLAEVIFLNLNHEDFEKYMEVDESWRKILENPSFLLRKCIQEGHFKTTKSAWKTTVQCTKQTKHEEFLTRHFLDVLKSFKTMRITILSMTMETVTWEWAA